MFEARPQKNLKNAWSIVLAFLLSACSVPGTYFSDSDVQNGYQVNGKPAQYDVNELNAKWLEKHQNDSPYTYVIGPYDILNIIVWNHPELTTPTNQLATPEENGILVDEEGFIFFPFAGKVKVSGLTFDQARIVIEEKLKEYIRDPQLSVRVAMFRSQQIQIVGEVVKPGVIPITDKPLSTMEAINIAGGVNSFTANTRQIFILYEKSNKIYIYWFDAQNPTSVIAANKFYLQNNVIIYVPPAGVSAWNRVISQILPMTSGATSTAQTVIS
ncbi:MAG: polysaccharide biosynthesis/export family protein [Pseudomonadota bacterium]